ncbi:MAG: ATP synthase F1 subunit delta [Muribaculaceae bacterium]|nr:ATP synthase F1 subunit delta [Muribaculaceae bacterium]
MNDGLIPNRYAKALYKLLQECGDTAAIYNEMKQLDASYAAEAGLKKAVNNPFLPVEDKLKLLCAASGAKLGGTSAKFMELVIKNNRIDFLRSIALAFMKQYREQNGIAKVEIVTAVQLGDDEINAIIDVVKEQFGDKTIELTKKVNPDLIGGFTVDVDSRVLDASVKNQLEKLRLKLLS